MIKVEEEASFRLNVGHYFIYYPATHISTSKRFNEKVNHTHITDCLLSAKD